MIFFPNCKLNLGLSVTDKRKDGYHNLETVFYPLLLHDIIEVVINNEPASHHSTENLVEFSCSGLPVAGDQSDNLCIKAYHLLKQDFSVLPRIKMHLHKAIPMGAGLGGGSSDGAFILLLLNEKFNLNLTTGQLIEYAARLGSDCPFFIINKPCFAASRGEVMELVSLDLSPYKIIVINCGIHVNTGWAFSRLVFPGTGKKARRPDTLKDIILQPVETWKDQLANDFEVPVFEEYPILGSLKTKLYDSGALYAAMTGSGSAVFGIFQKNVHPVFDFPDGYEMVEV